MNDKTNSPLHQPTQQTPNDSPAAVVRVDGNAATPSTVYDRSPQERVAADRAEQARRDPWYRGPEVVITGVDGYGQPIVKDRTAADSQAPGDQAGGQASNATVADGVLKVTASDGREISLSGDEIAGLMERRATEAARAAILPATAADYKIELPAGFTAEGVEVTLDPANPAFADLRALAHKNQWSQAQLSDVLGLYAGTIAKETALLTTARTAEIEKLGVNCTQRVEAVATWWSSMTGDDGKILAGILRQAPTAGTVQAFERLIQRYVNPAGGNPGGRREADDYGPHKATDAEYAAMSYTERKEYAAAYEAAQQRGRR